MQSFMIGYNNHNRNNKLYQFIIFDIAYQYWVGEFFMVKHIICTNRDHHFLTEPIQLRKYIFFRAKPVKKNIYLFYRLSKKMNPLRKNPIEIIKIVFKFFINIIEFKIFYYFKFF